MTLVLGLRSAGGVVLAADSQRTEGQFRQEVPKLFAAPAGIIWGTAGTIAIQQELFALLRELDVPNGLRREALREAIVRALRQAVRRATASMDEPSAVVTSVEGVFGWYSEHDRRDYLLQAVGSGHAELHPQYTAVGGITPKQLALFAFSRSEHLEYGTLPLEAAKMVAFNVADDVIRASASGVALPVQMAVVTAAGSSVLKPKELRGLEDTVAAFREHQQEFLGRSEAKPRAKRDTGLRP